MKIKEPKTMADLHRIRKKHYQETKGLSLKEVLLQVGEEALKIEKKYNLKLKKV